ncbi:unnamed protein product [Cyclocybe aegerita]|uniref:Uncharacterized protein n=1 Tax=Cyclocybe aegerita TaxID=1973307 RepID=A0A8S0W2Q2_CYCAE|nr:unnamed protein product [Cyclocybe aegerita]
MLASGQLDRPVILLEDKTTTKWDWTSARLISTFHTMKYGVFLSLLPILLTRASATAVFRPKLPKNPHAEHRTPSRLTNNPYWDQSVYELEVDQVLLPQTLNDTGDEGDGDIWDCSMPPEEPSTADVRRKHSEGKARARMTAMKHRHKDRVNHEIQVLVAAERGVGDDQDRNGDEEGTQDSAPWWSRGKGGLHWKRDEETGEVNVVDSDA